MAEPGGVAMIATTATRRRQATSANPPYHRCSPRHRRRRGRRRGEGSLAGTRVDSSLFASGVENVGDFALRVWDENDRREEIHQVAVALAIPNAQQEVFDLRPNAGSYSMGMMDHPVTLIVPEPAVIVRRGEVVDEQLVRRLVAEVRRVFADAGVLAR